MPLIPARKSFWGELLVYLMARRSIWRSFHGLYFRAAAPLPLPPAQLHTPVIFVSNHPSWWDGYIALMVMRQIYNLNPYLMMDERQLRRYIFFSWAGCFSVDQQNGRSALRSIEYISQELQAAPGRALWIFPQGDITPQEAPLSFAGGTAHTIRRIGSCIVYPVAFRLEFTREQFPSIFASVGPALRYGEDAKQKDTTPRSVKKITAELEAAVAAELERVRADVTTKGYDRFVPVIRGRSSTDTRFDSLSRFMPRIFPNNRSKAQE